MTTPSGTIVSFVGPAYSLAPLRRTHRPPKVFGDDGYRKYRACLRLEFQFRCAYCLSHESEVAPSTNYGGYDIEHFKPKGIHRFWRFRNDYRNLLWACRTCNQAKRSTWPNDEELRQGFRFIDPTAEALGDYLTIAGDEVRPTTDAAKLNAAQYTIDEIRLNSAPHRHRRKRRRELARRRPARC